MGKTALAGTSVIAAIPGAVLTYLMLMAVLNSFEPMPTMLKVAAIMVLVGAAAMALFPAYVLIWYSSGTASKAKSAVAPESPETEGDELVPAPDELEPEESLEEVVDEAAPDEGDLDLDETLDEVDETGELEGIDESGELDEFDEFEPAEDFGEDFETEGALDEEFEFEEFEDFDEDEKQ